VNLAHRAAPLLFEHFEVWPHERRLLVRGEAVALGARAFDLLMLLAESPGCLLAKEELLERVWPGVVVEENNLAVQVSHLRKALGGEVIATIPGRGYRFTARPAAAAAGNTAPAAPVDAPPTRAAAPPAGPAPLHTRAGPLFGRERELAELGSLVQAHELVTLAGAGGIGKSRLAQALIEMPQPERAHGTCWVPLGEIGQAPRLPAALASALGVGLGGGDPLVALAHAVAPLRVLVVLDGAEHLLAGVAALVSALLRASPGLRVLVTSQAPLGLPGEQVLRLGPLAVPERPLPAAQALAHGAVALFVQRAHAAGARFAPDGPHLAAAVELCRALDGLPLAIELAAARVPALGVSQLARSMRDRLSLLTHSRNPAAPARQQTLRAALEWSHGLLGEAERIVFRRLAVVAGSASLETILALGAEPEAGLDTTAVLDTLAALVDRSLVVVLDGAEATRYRLLDSPRLFALERLREAGEEPALRRRHAQAMAAAFDAAYDDYYAGRQGWAEWARRIETDLDNAREALAWALQAGEHLLALQLGPTLMRALPPAQVDERHALAESMLALAEADGCARLRLRAWFQLSTLWAESNRQRSHAASETVLRLARRLDAPQSDRFVLYNALCARARSAARLGDHGAAEAALQEACTLENPAWPAQRLYWGVEAAFFLARARGDAAAALHWLRRVLALQQAAGSDDAVMLANLIDAELAQGDVEAAVRSGRALVARLAASRNERDLAFARVNLAAALLAQGDTAAAREVAQQGWPQGRRFGLQPYWADYLALLAALEGRTRCAARLAAYADASYRARDEERGGNEAVAAARVQARLQAALAAAGAPLHERLRQQGESLREEEIAAQAFAHGDD
jgi:predicted ATPase/DNA-binding winged helix-turn-helix (wHTH) protein